MTIREAAAKYGVPYATLMSAVRRGDLPHTDYSHAAGRYGWRYDVRAADVRRWAKHTWRPKAV
jgi:hypothetical protein